MKLVIACDPKGGIGYKNKLPWDKIEGDLPRFKSLTMNKSIVMGKNTWESLPKKPLPGRTNYVFSSSGKPLNGALTINSTLILENNTDVWVIGGSKTIDTCWQYIDEIHLTQTIAEYTCDTFIDLVKLQKEFMCWFKEQHDDHTYEIWKRK